MLRYRVLGPTQALRPDGSEARLGGTRLRALLAALAAGAGHAVPLSVLITQVWGEGDAPPADEVAAVQALVGRLRRVLGPDAVESVPGGYRLAAQTDEIDLFRFERLVAEGATALAAGDAEHAAGLLADALTLWHGPALADLPEREGDPLVVRVERHRADARRNRLAAEVELGRAESALGELTALAATAPLDEPLQALHIRALRAAGRPAEALAAYESVRGALSERLGTNPGPELQSLHAELLNPARGGEGAGTGAAHTWSSSMTGPHKGSHDMASDRMGSHGMASPHMGSHGMAPNHMGSPHMARPHMAPPHMAPPHTGSSHTASSHIASHGRASSHTGPAHLASPQADPEPSPLRPPGNLRARLTSFVGRESDVRALHDDLRRERLVTLTGPGGAGKTRLAVEAADAVAGEWGDGVWLVELAPVRDAVSLAEAVLTALGARETRLVGPAETTPRDPLAQLLAHCGRLRTLIVLDNCEQVVDAAAELVQDLLTACPDVTVLATSREPLGVPGERVMAIGPLPHESALRLFGQRGAAARPGFRADDDPDAVTEICRRLDGLPLALELAAARLRLFTPRQIADRLDDRFRLLNTGPRTSRTLQPRQQTLRAVVDWSWDLLDAPERAVLRRLAVFAGGFALPEAEAVCADPEEAGPEATGPEKPGRRNPGAGKPSPRKPGAGVGPADVLDLLGSLVDKSLVTAAPAGDAGTMRYRLLETVAEYAAQRLDEAGERAEAELRHLVRYRELVRMGEAALRGPRQREVIERLEAEHDNVRAALRTAVGRGCEQDGLCLVLAMAWFWQLRGHQADARSWSGAVAELGPDPFAEPVRPAVALADRCTDSPPPWSEEQLWEARRGVRLMMFAASGGGDTELNSPETVAYLRRIVRAYGPGLPQNSRQPGSVWYFARLLTGEFTGFDRVVDEMVADARQHGGPWDLAFALLLRAKLLDGSDAEDALALFEDAGDPWGIAESLSARGESYEREGRYQEAAKDFERALESVTQMGAHAQVSVFKAKLASARVEVARTPAEQEAAERLLSEAVEESRKSPEEGLGTARMLLAQHFGRTGRTGASRQQLQLMEAEFTPVTPDLFRGLVAGMHGWLDCLDGKYPDAQDRIQEAVRHLESQAYLVAPNLILSQFLSAAWAKAELGAAADGARLLGAYDRNSTGRDSFGFRPLPAEPETRRQAEAALRAALDPAAYDRAYAEGADLDVRRAAALV
ncbi:BTAD domain-containing putative transcriptional regulator [Streptomyces violascens]|uniref:BTAD domain-containing putative transcriptional regulator n=1 Tax=Streptomyces violascens TaxID=67381 RepID=UPI003652948B